MRRASLLALLLPALAGLFVLQDAERPGYRDTPVIPGTRWRVHDADRPWPTVVTPGDATSAPSDAVVLFDGGSLDAWTSGGEAAAWTVEDGAMVVGKGTLSTREAFGDGYIKNVKLLRNAMDFAEQKASEPIRDISTIFIEETGLRSLMRFSRVIAAPLTRTGRALTATVGLTREQAQKAVVDALADPKKLQQMVKLRNMRMRSAAATPILGALGVDAIRLLNQESNDGQE